MFYEGPSCFPDEASLNEMPLCLLTLNSLTTKKNFSPIMAGSFFFRFFWGLARSSPPSIIKSPRLCVLVRVVVTNKSYPAFSSVAFSDRSGTNRMSSQVESTKAISTLRLLCCAACSGCFPPRTFIFFERKCVCAWVCVCVRMHLSLSRTYGNFFIIIINLGHDDCLTELLLEEVF